MRTYLEMAERLHLARKYDRAAQQYRPTVKQQPGLFEARYGLASVSTNRLTTPTP